MAVLRAPEGGRIVSSLRHRRMSQRRAQLFTAAVVLALAAVTVLA